VQLCDKIPLNGIITVYFAVLLNSYFSDTEATEACIRLLHVM